jgi:hypothetical protein
MAAVAPPVMSPPIDVKKRASEFRSVPSSRHCHMTGEHGEQWRALTTYRTLSLAN